MAVAISIEIALACVASACAKNEGARADAAPTQADGSPPPPEVDALPDMAPAQPDDGGTVDTSPAQPDGGDDGLEPIRVTGGRAGDAYHGFLVVGQAFSGLDGKIVTVRTGSPGSMDRLGSGQVRIEQGALSLRLPASIENGLYKQKIVHVDADGDGACGAADLIFHNNSAIATDPAMDVVFMVSPTSRFKASPLEFAGLCQVIQTWPSQ